MKILRFKNNNSSESSKIWWLETSANIVGTVVGIIITFGVGIWVDYHDKQKDNRLTTMMITYGLIERSDILYSSIEDIIEKSRILAEIPKLSVKQAETMPEDSVHYYLSAITVKETNYNDFARQLFNSNLDIFRKADNFKFLISAENAYNYLDRTEKLLEENGPQYLVSRVDQILKEEELRQGVSGMSWRWNLVEMIKSDKIREILENYADNFITGGPHILEELTNLKNSLMEVAKVTPEELQEFFELYEE